MLKRFFDIIFSLFGIVALLPLFVLIFILIKMFMPDGGVFFRQERIGRFGKKFNLIKFRTMKKSNSKNTIAALEDKGRITILGHCLRKSKIDEIPELWNVLRGEMSFVGPRPDVEGYADKLKGEDRNILKLRPGITGPASIKYANEEEILKEVNNPLDYNNKIIYPDKVKINLNYYNNNSLIGDLMIIIKTVFRKF